MTSGVYSITSPSGKKYIGSSIKIEKRWREHKYQLRTNRHHSSLLQKVSNKYGLENLQFDLLLICEPKNVLLYEQIYLDFYKPAYNICLTAGNTLGRKLSLETIEKIRERGKKQKLSCSHIEALVNSRKGKKASEETRRKMSESAKNRSCSTETRLKMAEKARARNWTLESREKIRLSKLGKKLNPVTRKYEICN